MFYSKEKILALLHRWSVMASKKLTLNMSSIKFQHLKDMLLGNFMMQKRNT